MTTTTTLNGQILGEAERATRALLDRLLARTGTAFHEWVALNFLAINGGAMPRSRLTQAMAGGLKIDESVVQATVSGLVANGLVVSGSDDSVALTDGGTARHREVRAGIDEIGTVLYNGLSAEDLATAGRVLTELTARANTQLAS